MKLFGLVITTQEKIDKEYNVDKINAVRELNKRLDIAEKINWQRYLELEELKKENLWLKNHQKIEIVNLNGGKE